ncbi:GNAT family N-acetyltransferase [Blastococcus tunisiensis]|uniref:Acetyltransferase (GNAT) family protein n=1 Tax=Blastococcus tunisiensis TaxID=1798228 RepID=A0A1I2CWU4_9ACTN|nr:GNAT family N-acetyltransferase [Blastococcus sp. DSM 46838]SFE72758.1 Acetyltransferase (GNAT) family protein [Blastococcus sp. DSM 46838]
MCTSVDGGRQGQAGGVLRDGAVATLRALPYDDPLAQYLVEAVQQEYVRRYGGRDAAAVDPAEFVPPRGIFLVAEVDGVPAGCGAWRALPSGEAEIKRVYVEPAFRRRGIARMVVAALEEGAAAAGHAQVVLNSGREQPEALTLYAELGYRPVPGYGTYACAPDAVFLGRSLPGTGEEQEPSWAS